MSDEEEFLAPDAPFVWPRTESGRIIQYQIGSNPPGYPAVRVVRGDKIIAEWPARPERFKLGRTAKMRRRLAQRDGMRCYLCGLVPQHLRDLRIEHKTPSSRGGSNTQDNLGLACAPCDVAKADLTEEEYRASLAGHAPALPSGQA